MYEIIFRTNNGKATLQAFGTLAGLAIGWGLTGNPRGGLLGSIAGALVTTLILELFC